MTALPPKANLTGATVTQGQFKTALDTVNDYLTGLLGADGTPATARAALGVVNDTAPTYAQVVAALGFTPYSVTSAVAKLDKTGDTMTGNLALSNGAVIKSVAPASDAKNTGYQVADGTDVGQLPRTNSYATDAINNCTGFVATGNCSGDPQWTPPNANWWEWYIGRTNQPAWANKAAFDGAGGDTYAYTPVTLMPNYTAYGIVAGTDKVGGAELRRTRHNCNCGLFNCRTNCNCNCDCSNCGGNCCGCC